MTIFRPGHDFEVPHIAGYDSEAQLQCGRGDQPYRGLPGVSARHRSVNQQTPAATIERVLVCRAPRVRTHRRPLRFAFFRSIPSVRPRGTARAVTGLPVMDALRNPHRGRLYWKTTIGAVTVISSSNPLALHRNHATSKTKFSRPSITYKNRPQNSPTRHATLTSRDVAESTLPRPPAFGDRFPAP